MSPSPRFVVSSKTCTPLQSKSQSSPIVLIQYSFPVFVLPIPPSLLFFEDIIVPENPAPSYSPDHAYASVPVFFRTDNRHRHLVLPLNCEAF
jgi:hypothetical protein